MICRLGMREDLPDAGLEVEDAGRAVEFLEHIREESIRVRRHLRSSETGSA